jgi:hypothetical protein
MTSDGHPAHDHERSDVQAPLVGWMALTLVVFMLITIPLLVGVFKVLKWGDERDQPERSPLAITEEPPAPVLQAVPSIELGEYRRQQRKLLDEYQWIDKQQQIVRIPIDEATRLVAERGLPKARPAAQGAAPPGTEKPEDAKPDNTKPGDAKPAVEASP